MDLISKKVAIEEFEDMVTSVSVYGESAEARYATNARVRFIEKLNNIPSVPAVPLDRLCELLSKGAYPCTILSADLCPFESCIATRRYSNDVSKNCWKAVLTKWMEGLDAKTD